MSYSDAAETASVRPIISSARASSSGVTTTEGDDVDVDGEVIAELIQILVSRSHVIVISNPWNGNFFLFWYNFV